MDSDISVSIRRSPSNNTDKETNKETQNQILIVANIGTDEENLESLFNRYDSSRARYGISWKLLCLYFTA